MKYIAQTPAGRADEPSAREKNVTCACTHPTHFLGSCQVKVNKPGVTCSECMTNHFVPNNDPTISKE